MPVFFLREGLRLIPLLSSSFVQIIGQRTICDVLLVEIRFDLGTVKQPVKQLFGQMLFGGCLPCCAPLAMSCDSDDSA